MRSVCRPSWLSALAGVWMLGCYQASKDYAGRPCPCTEGYVCDPRDNECAPEIKIGCDSPGATCPSTTQRGEFCSTEGSFLPCVDNRTDCHFGCRTCEGGTWSECTAGQSACTPGGDETCNGQDDDCDGVVDNEDAQGCSQYFRDDDGDGLGQGNDARCLCAISETYTAVVGGDCDDSSNLCNIECVDIDSDGLFDCQDTCVDVDGDGLGDGTLGNAGCAATTSDSDDTNANMCIDSDGDGCDDCAINAGPPDATNDGTDVDADGFCDVTDCDDTAPGINPSATEGPEGDATCTDGVDNDCDGSADGLDSACVVPVLEQVHFRFYVNTDAVQPSDPWPPGLADTAEDVATTDIAIANVVRLRISILASQSTFSELPQGLAGAFYDGMSFGALVSTTQDARIDFDPADTALGADRANGPDTFSARWTGYVKADFTENYTFYTVSDEGVRLLVDGVPLIDNWTSHLSTEDVGSIDLTAREWYPIRLEFYENTGDSVIQLSYSSSNVPRLIIPTTHLAPGGFKLQHAISTAGPWKDVEEIGGAGTWRGYNNAAPADGTVLGSALLTGSTILETYEEGGVTAPAYEAIRGGGEAAEWDWTLQNNGAPAGGAYYFRMVQADGTALDTYSLYPQLTTAVDGSRIILRGKSQESSDSPNLKSAPMPTGTVEGDLMIATVVHDTSVLGALSSPAGWTLIEPMSLPASQWMQTNTWYRVAQVGESGPYKFETSSTTRNNWIVHIASFYHSAGVGVWTLVDASYVYDDDFAGTATMTSGAVATVGTALVFAGFANDRGWGVSVPPASMVEVFWEKFGSLSLYTAYEYPSSGMATKSIIWTGYDPAEPGLSATVSVFTWTP